MEITNEFTTSDVLDNDDLDVNLDDLEVAWRFYDKKPLEIPGLVWQEIIDRHEDSHRHFHTWKYIDNCLELYFKYVHVWNAVTEREVFLALLFNDYCFDPVIPDNEKLSANFAKIIAMTLSANTHETSNFALNFDYIVKLIESVADRTKPSPKLTPVSLDTEEEALFIDITCDILAASEEVYDQYVDDLEQEYLAIGGSKFALNRKLWLTKMLSGNRIFLSATYLDKEVKAKENLERELKRRTVKVDRLERLRTVRAGS